LKTVLDAFFGKNSYEALLPFSLKKLTSSSLKGRFPKWNISVRVIFWSALCLNDYLGIIFASRKSADSYGVYLMISEITIFMNIAG
jgi:hypothetical protein